jgi:hypothetical protein
MAEAWEANCWARCAGPLRPLPPLRVATFLFSPSSPPAPPQAAERWQSGSVDTTFRTVTSARQAPSLRSLPDPTGPPIPQPSPIGLGHLAPQFGGLKARDKPSGNDQPHYPTNPGHPARIHAGLRFPPKAQSPKPVFKVSALVAPKPPSGGGFPLSRIPLWLSSRFWPGSLR